MNKALLIPLIILVAILIVMVVERQEDTNVVEVPDDEEIDDGVDMSRQERERLVERYIRDTISELSPEPEVLGGTFYVTEVEFTSESTGEVKYEDGHIALVADFEYSVISENDVDVTLSNVREQTF